MKQLLLSFIFAFASIASIAQPTWSEDAAEVFFDKCAKCHNPDGVAPFSILDYSTAYDYRSLIQSYVEYNIMPPWFADSSFQHYFDERILTEYERNTIIDWANGGGLEGPPELAPPPPVFDADQILPGTPDLVVEMPMYMSKATEAYDDYICITIPTGLANDRKVKSIEIIPGNPSIVHHCLVYADDNSDYPTDTIGGNCGGPSVEPLMAGYTPGARPTIFPSSEDFSAGMVLSEGSSIVFALHYPHGSYGEYDQTKVHFYFYEEPVADFREILAGAFLQNWDFDLPADEITAVDAAYDDVGFDLTVLSTFPHMHLLGKSIEAYALDPGGDTIPFIRIPQWDFDWQDFYWFEYMQKMPAGSNLRGQAVYDNTSANPHNPEDPPIDVNPGFNTTDEMFLVYFHIMGYEEGDEFVNLDSLNTIYLEDLAIQEGVPLEKEINVYPNPFDETIAIEYNLTEKSHVSLFVYDLNGKVVRKLYRGEQEQGAQSVVWDGKTEAGAEIANGVYNYSMLIEGKHYSGRIIKK
ncbi:MAG: hypothetical protein ACI8ZM_004478 [Crocinitomix sp.]|jgi:hypothetical protein